MEEVWKQYRNTMYYVSSWGNVKSSYFNKEKLMKPQLTSSGYHIVNLAGKSKMFIHRLVAITHLGEDPKRPFVNHKNAVKTDNRVDNLEWCTVEENNKHAIENGLGTPSRPVYVINLQNEVLGHYTTKPKARAAHGYKKNIIVIFEDEFTDEIRLSKISETPTERKKVDRSNFRSLNKTQVLFIRKTYAEKTYTQKYLSELFNLDPSTISSVVLGSIYADITP